MRSLALGVIVGNRGFFPDHLSETGRQDSAYEKPFSMMWEAKGGRLLRD